MPKRNSKTLAYIIRTSSSEILNIYPLSISFKYQAIKKIHTNPFFDTFFRRFHAFTLAFHRKKNENHIKYLEIFFKANTTTICLLFLLPIPSQCYIQTMKCLHILKCMFVSDSECPPSRKNHGNLIYNNCIGYTNIK